MQEFRVVLPEKFSVNKWYAGIHWRVRKDIADLYHDTVFLESKHQKLKPVLEYPVHMKYVFYFKKNPLDATNCAALCKLIEDGLVRAKILQNDTPNYVSGITIESRKGNWDEVVITF